MKTFSASYFEENDVIDIAQQLLGARIESFIDGKLTSGIICETEAYRAPEDKASHAYNNRRTARTETMFGPAGRAYVYLCYGIHHLFNIVTGAVNTPHAVLIRGVMPIDGIEYMLARRNTSNRKLLTNGPGKWTQAFGINTELNGINLFDHDSPIKLFPPEKVIDPRKTEASPRVGINYAEEWIAVPWRFKLSGQLAVDSRQKTECSKQ